MKENVKTYEKYKDSGVEWIGNIPQHWKVRKLKHLFKFGKGLTITRENLQDDGIKCVNYGEIHSKYPVHLRPEVHPLRCVSEDYLENNKYSLISKGDIVFADTSEDIEGSGNFTCLLSDIKIFAGYHTIVVKPTSIKTLGHYFSYLFDSIPMRTQIRSKVQGIKVYSISQGILKNNLCFYPPFEEQKVIAGYLDKKCGLIDSTIEKEKSVIEKLKQYKQSIITEAVTKGLDKSAPLKDSGIEWIGKIPQHWEVQRLKYKFKIKKDIAGVEGFDILSVTQRGLKIKDISSNEGQLAMDYSKYQIVNQTDFVMNHMDLLTGWVDCSIYPGVTSPDYRVFCNCDKKNCLNEYYKYIFQSCYKNKIFYGLGAGVSDLGRWRLQADKFLNFFIPVPTYVEQEIIAEFITSKCSEIDKAVEDKGKIIEKLTQYKKTLIYECVTGKRKVL